VVAVEYFPERADHEVAVLVGRVGSVGRWRGVGGLDSEDRWESDFDDRPGLNPGDGRRGLKPGLNLWDSGQNWLGIRVG
jgi:hypothetical protein